jgi:2-dehydropantoate 2-reductase
MKFVDTLPKHGTTSLQRDLDEGKPSELSFWNGAVVRFAKELAVPTPLNDFIYHSLLPRELQARVEAGLAG